MFVRKNRTFDVLLTKNAKVPKLLKVDAAKGLLYKVHDLPLQHNFYTGLNFRKFFFLQNREKNRKKILRIL